MEKTSNIGRKVRIKNYAVYRGEYEGQIGIVSKEYEDTETLEVYMPDGEMIMPYAPDNEDAQCEWVVEEQKKENLAGKRVKITDKKGYPSYVGQIGTITDTMGEADGLLSVTLESGIKLMPWGPEYHKPQCELLPEENEYHIDKLKGTKTAIHCTTAEEYKQVVKLMDAAYSRKMFNDIQGWKSYEDEVVVYCNGYPLYGSKRYAKEDGSKIITAEQFIQANQPTMNKNTQALEQIELLKAQILKIEESLKEPVWEPKVGEYVTCKPGYKSSGGKSDPQYAGAGYKEGHTYKITKVEEAPKHDSKWVLQGGNDDCGVWSAYVRPATPEEIAANQQVTVTIGTEGKVVTISKGKIMAPDGKTVTIKDINMVCGIMVGTRGFNSWTVTFPEVKIGCVESISYDQLKAVQDAYHKING